MKRSVLLIFVSAFMIALGSLATAQGMSQELKPGTMVLAPRSHAEYAVAKVLKVAGKGYLVELGSGDTIEALQDELALDIDPKPAQIKQDMRLVAKWSDGGWYPARVLEILPEGLSIAYDDGTLELSDPSRLRVFLPPKSTASVANQPPPSAAPQVAAVPEQVPAPASAPISPPATQPAPAPNDGFAPPLASILGEASTTYRWNYKLKAPAGAKGLVWSDATIELTVAVAEQTDLIGPEAWAFSLRNKTQSPVSVDWDGCWITSTKGKRRPLFHGDLGSVDFSGKQAPAQLPAGARIEEQVAPKDGYLIRHNKAQWNDRGEWVEAWDQIEGYSVFFGEDFTGLEGYDQIKAAIVGREFTLHLAVKMGGTNKAYDFVFEVTDIAQTKHANPFGF